MRKVLIIANHFIVAAFRRELVEKLISDGNEVYIALPETKDAEIFSNMGCKIIDTPIERRSTNFVSDFKLLFQYIKIISSIKPDVTLTYTIKPNIYGGIAARFCKVKVMHTVTGLGSVFIQDMWQKSMIIFLNKIAFKSAWNVFFLNEDNKEFYRKVGIISDKHSTVVVPGSGVNLQKFKYVEQHSGEKIIFTFVARVLKDKGIEEYLSAAKELITLYDNIEFEVVGFVDEDKYIGLLNKYEENGIIKYLGNQSDIPKIMERSSCIVLPSYGEGRGTVLQEGAAIGRPLITCDTYGCKENVEEGYNGFLCKVADVKSLKETIEKFINLSQEEKVLMGKRGREKAEKEFDREIVIKAYIQEIDKICK